jgi:uncharacterized membrane protein
MLQISIHIPSVKFQNSSFLVLVILRKYLFAETVLAWFSLVELYCTALLISFV